MKKWKSTQTRTRMKMENPHHTKSTLTNFKQNDAHNDEQGGHSPPGVRVGQVSRIARVVSDLHGLGPGTHTDARGVGGEGAGVAGAGHGDTAGRAAGHEAASPAREREDEWGGGLFDPRCQLWHFPNWRTTAAPLAHPLGLALCCSRQANLSPCVAAT